jgi:hypothetical protein
MAAVNSKHAIANICRFMARKHFPLGAVRVHKLLYLMECEFYRWERARLTDEEWIFFHYGPWSPTLNTVLEQEFDVRPEILPDGRTFKDIKYLPPEFSPLPENFGNPTVDGIFLNVMEAWADKPMNELLDFVYFHTYPMQNAKRRHSLDFSTIPSAKEEREPINPYKGLSAKAKATVKQAFEERRKRVGQQAVAAQPWPVDDLLLEAIKDLEARETTPPMKGEVQLDAESAEHFRGDPDAG